MEPKGIILVEDPGPRSPRSVGDFPLGARQHIANRPIAHHVVEELESIGVREIIVTSSTRWAGEIRDCLAACEQRGRARLQYVAHDGPVDLAGGLGLAAPSVGGAPCVAHLVNGLLAESLSPFTEILRGDAPDVMLIVHHGTAPDEQLSQATQAMLRVVSLDPERSPLGMAGVLAFGPGGLRHVGTGGSQNGDAVNVTKIAERITEAGGNVQVREAEAWRRYAGDPLDLLELNRIALDRLEAEIRVPNNNGNRIEGRVWIHESASVHGCVIVGPTVIGADAVVADAYLGPYTSVGSGVRIEGAEIERSIIQSGASIMHVDGRIVASVVGRNARVFRDFSLPRALRLRVGDGTEVALS